MITKPFREKTACPVQAVIYCRVSDKSQTIRGSGLSSQETRCREYAQYRGYTVLGCFTDDMTGKVLTRPGLQSMLKFIRKHRTQGTVVIIDDISRMARDTRAHWELRDLISEAGGHPESPSYEFRDNADSRMVENVLAGAAQHQREKNQEQTINRMRARLMNGYWCFQPPTGYVHKSVRGHGKLITRDEPIASIIAEALEGFASGRFGSQVEVKRFLESQAQFPRCLPNGEIRNQHVRNILERPVYAGMVEAPKWNVSMRKGRHEGLISLETWHKIQELLRSGAKLPARKDINADFPLRGFVLCGDCAQPMTACWSKSKTGKKHPYYMCFKKGCVSYRKSIKRELIEGEFETLLSAMQPARMLVTFAKAMFRDIWDALNAQSANNIRALKKSLRAQDRKIEQLLDRIVETDNATVVAAYEKRVTALEKEKLLIAEKIQNSASPKGCFDRSFELALAFLSNPQKLWRSGRLELQRTVLKLAFAEPPLYDRDKGFRTPNMALPFKALGAFCGEEREMARP